jgi:hypothetical protein
VILSKDVRRIGAAIMAEMAVALIGSAGLERQDVRYWMFLISGHRDVISDYRYWPVATRWTGLAFSSARVSPVSTFT